MWSKGVRAVMFCVGLLAILLSLFFSKSLKKWSRAYSCTPATRLPFPLPSPPFSTHESAQQVSQHPVGELSALWRGGAISGRLHGQVFQVSASQGQSVQGRGSMQYFWLAVAVIVIVVTALEHTGWLRAPGSVIVLCF